MNQPKSRTRKELYDYLHHTLGFTRVKTATPGERLYAHLVPGTKRLWIPIELTGSDRDIVDRVMRYARYLPPSPSKIPERFKIRKVGKKVQIYEERKPLYELLADFELNTSNISLSETIRVLCAKIETL